MDKHDNTDLEELTQWTSCGIIIVGGLVAGFVVIGLGLLAFRAAL